jgi:26S proteasome regulatory subunit N6
MAPAPKTSKRVTEAQNLSKVDSKRAEEIYKDIISKGAASGDAGLHEYEAALMGLGKLYRDAARSNDLAELVTTSRSKLSSFAKAKTAKLGTG